jgi:hypothetical protein
MTDTDDPYFDEYLRLCKEKNIRPLSKGTYVQFRVLGRTDWTKPPTYGEYQAYVQRSFALNRYPVDWVGYQTLCAAPPTENWTDISEAMAKDTLARVMRKVAQPKKKTLIQRIRGLFTR